MWNLYAQNSSSFLFTQKKILLIPFDKLNNLLKKYTTVRQKIVLQTCFH